MKLAVLLGHITLISACVYCALALVTSLALDIYERAVEGGSSIQSLPVRMQLFLVATTPIEMSAFVVRALLARRDERNIP